MNPRELSQAVILGMFILCGTGRDAVAGTYTTAFPAAENPISEGGKWIDGAVVGLDWSNCASAGGMIQGRQNNGDGPNYNDSTALLTGTWGSNQTVTVKLHRGAVDESTWPEVEIRLRSALSAHSCTGYECLFSLRTTSDRYISIVRWDGAFGSFAGVANVSGLYNITNGSTLEASIVGSNITLYVDGTVVLTGNDSTYSTGAPGVGFDHNFGSANDSTFGFTSFTATGGIDAPMMITQPQSQVVNANSNVTLAVMASGASPLFYQWYFNSTNAIVGATNTELTISNVQTNQAGGYKAVVNNVFGSATSSVAQLTVSAPSNTSSTQANYLTSSKLGTLRNDFSGYVGMQVMVGSSPITVTALGRIMASGNSGTHTVKLVKVSDGTDVPGGSVSIAMSGGTVGQFQYANLSSPVVLSAGTAYYVMSQESAGADGWYSNDSTVQTTSVAKETSSAWGYGVGQWNANGAAGQTYGPLDFKYSSSSAPPPPPPGAGYVTSETLGTLHNNFSGYVGMQIVVGNNPISVTTLGRMKASGNIGTHIVKLVKVSDGTDVPGGSVSIAMSGGTVGQFQYATLSSPVVLSAGTAYYLMSQESAGGDSWYYNDTTIQTTSVAKETSSVWGYGVGQWNANGAADQTYGPLDFKY